MIKLPRLKKNLEGIERSHWHGQYGRTHSLLSSWATRFWEILAGEAYEESSRVRQDEVRSRKSTAVRHIGKDPLFKEIFDFNAVSLGTDLKRYGTRLRRAVHDWVAEQFLPDGLTILDHLELVFALGIDPTTTWYNDAVGNRRILLVLTGRMAGQLCRCGQHTLTRGDQPIVELEA